MEDGSGLAEALLGLDGLVVAAVTEGADEVVVTVETTARIVGCPGCGTRAEAQDRMPVRHARSQLLWAPGAPGVDQAAVALRRGGLRGQALDRALRPRRRAQVSTLP